MTSQEPSLCLVDPDIQLYKRRWFFLLLLFLVGAGTMYTNITFGVNVLTFSTYYDVPSSQIDLLTVGVMIGGFLATPVFMFLSYTNALGMKRSITVSIFLKVIGLSFIIFSGYDRNRFALAAVGQVIEGFANVVMITLFSSFTQLWFPDNQIGTAIGISSISISFGNFIGLVLPVRFLEEHRHLFIYSNATSFTATTDWINETGATIRLVYTPVVIIYTVTFILLSIFLTDLPPKPPTLAQAAKRSETSASAVSSLKSQLKSFLKDSRDVLSNISFTIDSILVGLLVYSMTCEFIMLSEILQLMPDYTADENPSITASNLLVTYAGGRIVGAIASGKIMDYCKAFKTQVMLSCLLSFISSCLILVAYLLTSYWLLYLSHAVYGVGVSGATVALYELVTQHTYPIDEKFVSYWRTIFYFLAGIVLPLLARSIFESTAVGYSSLVFRTVILLLCFGLTFFLSNEYKRLNYERENKSNKTNDDVDSNSDENSI